MLPCVWEGYRSKSWKCCSQSLVFEQLLHLLGLTVKEEDYQSLWVGGALTIGQVILPAIGMSAEIFLCKITSEKALVM